MSDTEYIKQLEAENELLKQRLNEYLESNWESSPSLGLTEGEHYTRVNAPIISKNGRMINLISRKFTSLRSMRDFVKSQSAIHRVYVLFDEKEHTIYRKLSTVTEKMVPTETSYILRFGVASL